MLLRYPGSKDKLWQEIVNRWFPEPLRPGFDLWRSDIEYREPFFGAGAIGFRVLPQCRKAWINDKDQDLISLWLSVLHNPGALCLRIRSFNPSVEAFFEYKSCDGNGSGSQLDKGFRKLALHQMSYSGLGAMAGGPIGGKGQANSKYPISCRWQPVKLQRTVWKLHEILSGVEELKITHHDFDLLVKGAPQKCFIYADPPYWDKGPDLYKHGMAPFSHERLAQSLRTTKADWVLSYDSHTEIERLYRNSVLDYINHTYTVSCGANRKNQELIIRKAV
jgi:DNA adenine methylase